MARHKPTAGIAAGEGAQRSPGRAPGVPVPLGLSFFYNKSAGNPDFHSGNQPRTVVLDNREMRLKRLRTGLAVGARLMQEQWQAIPHVCLMVTLTYRPGVEWKAKHISAYCNAFTKWLERQQSSGCYLWVMETTKAGVPHYHVLIWMKKGLFMPKADRRGWWPHGMTKTEVAVAPVQYMAKYTSKGFEHALPRRARIAGGGGLLLEHRRSRSWCLLPAYARRAFDTSDDVIRAPGGGFLSRRTGHFLISEWQLCAVGRGKVRLVYRGAAGGADFSSDVPVAHVVSGARAVRVESRDGA